MLSGRWGAAVMPSSGFPTAADLVLAEQLVEQEQRLVHSQRGFIARLEAQHHNTKAAETLLRSMLTTLAILEEHRDRIRAARGVDGFTGLK